MQYRYALPVLCAGLLAACNPFDDDKVRFQPDAGDERTFQVVQLVEADVESPFGNQTEQLTTEMLVRYRVEEGDAGLVIRTIPLYFMAGDGRGPLFSSVEVGSRDLSVLGDIMSAGFLADLDPEEGRMTGFRAADGELWAQFEEEHPHISEVMGDLEEQLGQPGLLTALPAEEGAELTMDGWGEWPELGVTVAEVSDSHVTVLVEAERQGDRVFGVMVLDRETGWMERLFAVSETDMEEDRFSGRVRQSLAMVPEGWEHDLPGMFDLARHNAGLEPELAELWEPYGAATEDAAASADEVWPSDIGVLDRDNGRELQLKLEHLINPESVQTFGQMRVSGLRLLDKHGDEVDLAVHSSPPTMQYGFDDSRRMSTVHTLHPLGWQDMTDRLQAVEAIQAEAAWHPVTVHEVEISLDDEAETREVETGGARFKVTALDAAGEYRVDYWGGPGQLYPWWISPAPGARGMLLRTEPDALPEWFGFEEAVMLDSIRHEYQRVSFHLAFDEPPEQLTLPVYSHADEPAFTRSLRYMTREQRLADLDVPPPGSRPLFHQTEEDFGSADGRLSDPGGKPVPFGEESNQLHVVLSGDQQLRCRLTVENDAQGQGRALVWTPERSTWWSGDEGVQLPHRQRYILRTEDGHHQYFYDLEVESRLRCRGGDEWVPVRHALDDRPWMVDLRALLGDEFDEDLAMRTLLTDYRFLDAQGEALGVLPNGREELAGGLAEASLSAYLEEEHYIRVMGEAVGVEQRVARDETLDRRWTSELPPLP
ncbi:MULTISPECIES: hypothetical protein [unclassified Thioalkalivibrio]|uniref:hypothetical protein n=1 Tax=unclassified Thioalkalivibrio TaxID=2621013 RepID=UPI000361F535|nr:MULTISPECIES: hypothetical protein [unclassified Thioalkalivibrio]